MSFGAVGTPLFIWVRTPLIRAKVAEDGGSSPDVIKTNVGEPLHLKLTSDDVVHGFAVGQMDMQSVDIMPGKVTNLTLNFDKPGIYTFFCTRWCGLNHWRMRGTIEVSGSSPDPEPALSEAERVPMSKNVAIKQAEICKGVHHHFSDKEAIPLEAVAFRLLGKQTACSTLIFTDTFALYPKKAD